MAFLEARDITVRFGGIVAVDGCSLAVEAGSITGLIGPNGAGKTTLFNILAGALAPSAGRVILNGADVTGQPPHRLFARGLSRTFQIPHEFARMTVLENLAVVPGAQVGEGLWGAWALNARVAREEAAIRARARAVLEQLKLDRLADAPAGTLSGGQKKLLELGRAMMAQAQVILLDEPAAGVNRTLMADLNERIRELNRAGVTFLIIEHDLGLVEELCALIHVMAEGKLMMSGTMAAIRADARVQEAYLGNAP